MSTYSQYGTGSFDEGAELVANESYFGVVGCYNAIEECAMNEHTIFESIIGRDFAEVYAEMGVIEESTFESLNESAIGDALGKVAAFFKKIGEKIMGILKSFRDRIVATFIRDGKELVKKYDKQITKKINTNKMTKFSFKMYDRVNKDENGSDNVQKAFNNSDLGKELLKQNENLLGKMPKLDDTLPGSPKVPGLVKEDTISDLKDKCCSDMAKTSTTYSDMKKDMIDAYKDTETEKEGLDSSSYSEIKEILQNYSDMKKFLEKNEKAVKKYYGDMVKEAERAQKKVDTAMTKDGATKTYAPNLNARCSNVIKLGNAISACVTSYYTAVTMKAKMEMKNARSIFVRAATYGGKDEATLMEAVSEVSDYEVDEMFA